MRRRARGRSCGAATLPPRDPPRGAPPRRVPGRPPVPPPRGPAPPRAAGAQDRPRPRGGRYGKHRTPPPSPGPRRARARGSAPRRPRGAEPRWHTACARASRASSSRFAPTPPRAAAIFRRRGPPQGWHLPPPRAVGSPPPRWSGCSADDGRVSSRRCAPTSRRPRRRGLPTSGVFLFGRCSRGSGASWCRLAPRGLSSGASALPSRQRPLADAAFSSWGRAPLGGKLDSGSPLVIPFAPPLVLLPGVRALPSARGPRRLASWPSRRCLAGRWSRWSLLLRAAVAAHPSSARGGLARGRRPTCCPSSGASRPSPPSRADQVLASRAFGVPFPGRPQARIPISTCSFEFPRWATSRARFPWALLFEEHGSRRAVPYASPNACSCCSTSDRAISSGALRSGHRGAPHRPPPRLPRSRCSTTPSTRHRLLRPRPPPAVASRAARREFRSRGQASTRTAHVLHRTTRPVVPFVPTGMWRKPRLTCAARRRWAG